jgi:flagellar biosynthesis GTPase FlhF
MAGSSARTGRSGAEAAAAAAAAAGGLVLEESVDEDGRRERRVADLDSVEDARALRERAEVAAMERQLWGDQSRAGEGQQRPRGLGGGAEWPRMPGMPAIQSSSPSPRRSPRRAGRNSSEQQQQQQRRPEAVDLFGDTLQRSKGILRAKQGRSAPSSARMQTKQHESRQPATTQKRRRSAPSAEKAEERKEDGGQQEEEEEIDDLDKRNLKRILVDQLRLDRTDLCTLTPARLRRKCASAMAFAPDRLDGPRAISMVDQWIKDELLADPAGYLLRAGR